MVPICTPLNFELGFPRFFMYAGTPNVEDEARAVPVNARAVVPKNWRLVIG